MRQSFILIAVLFIAVNGYSQTDNAIGFKVENFQTASGKPEWSKYKEGFHVKFDFSKESRYSVDAYISVKDAEGNYLYGEDPKSGERDPFSPAEFYLPWADLKLPPGAHNVTVEVSAYESWNRAMYRAVYSEEVVVNVPELLKVKEFRHESQSMRSYMPSKGIKFSIDYEHKLEHDPKFYVSIQDKGGKFVYGEHPYAARGADGLQSFGQTLTVPWAYIDLPAGTHELTVTLHGKESFGGRELRDLYTKKITVQRPVLYSFKEQEIRVSGLKVTSGYPKYGIKGIGIGFTSTFKYGKSKILEASIDEVYAESKLKAEIWVDGELKGVSKNVHVIPSSDGYSKRINLFIPYIEIDLNEGAYQAEVRLVAENEHAKVKLPILTKREIRLRQPKTYVVNMHFLELPISGSSGYDFFGRADMYYDIYLQNYSVFYSGVSRNTNSGSRESIRFRMQDGQRIKFEAYDRDFLFRDDFIGRYIFNLPAGECEKEWKDLNFHNIAGAHVQVEKYIPASVEGVSIKVIGEETVAGRGGLVVEVDYKTSGFDKDEKLSITPSSGLFQALKSTSVPYSIWSGSGWDQAYTEKEIEHQAKSIRCHVPFSLLRAGGDLQFDFFSDQEDLSLATIGTNEYLPGADFKQVVSNSTRTMQGAACVPVDISWDQFKLYGNDKVKLIAKPKSVRNVEGFLFSWWYKKDGQWVSFEPSEGLMVEGNGERSMRILVPAAEKLNVLGIEWRLVSEQYGNVLSARETDIKTWSNAFEQDFSLERLPAKKEIRAGIHGRVLAWKLNMPDIYRSLAPEQKVILAVNGDKVDTPVLGIDKNIEVFLPEYKISRGQFVIASVRLRAKNAGRIVELGEAEEKMSVKNSDAVSMQLQVPAIQFSGKLTSNGTVLRLGVYAGEEEITRSGTVRVDKKKMKDVFDVSLKQHPEDIVTVKLLQSSAVSQRDEEPKILWEGELDLGAFSGKGNTKTTIRGSGKLKKITIDVKTK